MSRHWAARGRRVLSNIDSHTLGGNALLERTYGDAYMETRIRRRVLGDAY
jgi:hypothetical protein